MMAHACMANVQNELARSTLLAHSNHCADIVHIDVEQISIRPLFSKLENLLMLSVLYVLFMYNIL